MLRHVVLFEWKPEATEEQKRRMTEEIGRLPAAITDIRSYRFGHDAAINQGNPDFALVADFDDADGYRAYRDHPVHRAFLAEHITPILARRISIQYEF
jgi:Stress responsive A/B Barrel Domain